MAFPKNIQKYVIHFHTSEQFQLIIICSHNINSILLKYSNEIAIDGVIPHIHYIYKFSDASLNTIGDLFHHSHSDLSGLHHVPIF